MNFNFHESNSARRKRLFIPLNAFSFASFMVPIKFRQPTFARASAFTMGRSARFNRTRRLDDGAN